MHLGESRQGEREQATTDSHHQGVDESTGSSFLQQALAIAASSYPSPLNKYEMSSPKCEASAQGGSERAQEQVQEQPRSGHAISGKSKKVKNALQHP